MARRVCVWRCPVAPVGPHPPAPETGATLLKGCGKKIMEDEYRLAWANIEGWINQRQRAGLFQNAARDKSLELMLARANTDNDAQIACRQQVAKNSGAVWT